MSVLKLAITSKRPVAYLSSQFETTTDKHAVAQRIINFLQSLQTGTELAASASAPPSIAISVQDSQVQASGTIAFSAQATANDTILINGVTFTCAASPTGNQWAPGANAAATASNLATAINASATALVSGYVTASASAGTLTITSAFYGLSGNQCTIAKGVDSGTVMTVSGARLTGGAEDSSAKTLSF
jgi:phage tail sheath gpL-like